MNKNLILSILMTLIGLTAKSQTTHVVYFDSTNTIGNTDTTLTVLTGDSLVVIHNQDDDDFDVLINNNTNIGSYNITYGDAIYAVKITNDTINNILVTYYDPNQYRLINLNHSAVGLIENKNVNKLRLYPNPIESNSILHIDGENMYDKLEVFSLTGELKAVYQIKNQSSIKLNLHSGSYILKTINSTDKSYSVNKINVL